MYGCPRRSGHIDQESRAAYSFKKLCEATNKVRFAEQATTLSGQFFGAQPFSMLSGQQVAASIMGWKQKAGSYEPGHDTKGKSQKYVHLDASQTVGEASVLARTMPRSVHGSRKLQPKSKSEVIG